MAVVTPSGGEVISIEKTPVTLVFEMDWTLDAASVTTTVRKLPVGTVILRPNFFCVSAAVGTAVAKMNFLAGDTEFASGTADNAGTAGFLDYPQNITQLVIDSDHQDLKIQLLKGSGTMTTGPVGRCFLSVYRPNL